MSHPNINKERASDEKLAAGIAKFVDPAQTFVIAGKTYTIAQVLAALQERIDKAKSVPVAKATWLALLRALQAEYDQSKPFVAAIRQAMRIMFAASPDALTEMGVGPRKTRRILPVTDKALAIQKSKATRVARHTMGKRQREAITGSPSAPEPAPMPNPQPNGASP